MIEEPMPFEILTKIRGDHTRHLEQLWDEIKKLKERISILEKENENRLD
jgi:hypothetical protein